MHVCENESCTPLCVSECSPPALHLQAEEVKDGVGEGARGLKMDVILLLMMARWTQTSLRSIVLS